MARFEVVDADRKVKRDITKVFSDNFLKVITELILNSDDSYNRLESENGLRATGKIVIWLDRKKRLMKVLDQAEGMSLGNLETIFSHYGGDYARGSKTRNVRGLFGQGASDVLFLSALNGYDSYIVTVRNDEASRCDFKIEDNKKIGEAYSISGDVDIVRQKYGIIKNGTLVVFGIPKSMPIPKSKDIKDKIESFSMLRFILSNQKREVFLYDGNLKFRLNSSKYMFTNHEVLIKNKTITLKTDIVDLKSNLTLFSKQPDEPQMIIIRDEHNIVYDETLFGLEHIHGSKYIAGEYIIYGIYDYLKAKLNADKPEEVLRDSRDGFDGRNPFTKQMNERVRKVLTKVIEDNNIRRESESYSLNTNKKLLNALRKINSYFNKLDPSNIAGINPGENPPGEGLRFARPTISITKGKLYGLHLYINPNMIDPEESIELEYEDNKFVSIETKTVTYKEKDIRANDIVYKTIAIRGLRITASPIVLKAKYNSYTASVLINVVKEKIIYPTNGLEFIPKRRNIAPNKQTTFSLYFDTEYIPLGSEILIEIDHETQLLTDQIIHVTVEEDMVAETIGEISVLVSATEHIEKISLFASYLEISTEAACYVKEPKEKDDGGEGILNSLKLVFEPNDIWQTTVIPEQGILEINGAHPINQNILGSLKKIDSENPVFQPEQERYLYELIAFESAKLFELGQYEKLEKEIDDPEKLFRKIQRHKTEVYKNMIE